MSECRGVDWRFIRRKGLARDLEIIFAKHEHSATLRTITVGLRYIGRNGRYKR